MTHRYPPRSTLLLLLLALAALAGCPSKPTPPAEQPYSEVQFDMTVPPETPVDATLLLQGSDPAFNGPGGQGLELIYQGGTTYSVKTRLPKRQEISYSVRMTTPNEHMPLDAAGVAVPARTITLHQDEENVSFTVERWGPRAGITQPQTVFLVAVTSCWATGTGRGCVSTRR